MTGIGFPPPEELSPIDKWLIKQSQKFKGKEREPYATKIQEITAKYYCGSSFLFTLWSDILKESE